MAGEPLYGSSGLRLQRRLLTCRGIWGDWRHVGEQDAIRFRVRFRVDPITGAFSINVKAAETSSLPSQIIKLKLMSLKLCLRIFIFFVGNPSVFAFESRLQGEEFRAHLSEHLHVMLRLGNLLGRERDRSSQWRGGCQFSPFLEDLNEEISQCHGPIDP